MNLRRIMSLVLALMIAMSAAALAEADDIQAQLEAAQARVTELEAEVEKYRPVYESQVVAEYGDDGIILLNDARQQYDGLVQMYTQYGYPVDQIADQLKETVLTGMVQTEVVYAMRKELGLDPLDDQTMTDLKALAAEDLENFITYNLSRFAKEGATEEETRQATIDALTNAGYTEENLLAQRVEDMLSQKLVEYVTKDVTVTEDEVKDKYDEMVKDAEDNFTDDYTFVSARTGGDTIAWNPEGYRAVKHVLIQFNDDQKKQYEALNSTLTTLEDELEEATSKDDEEEPKAEEAETAEAEEAEAAEAEEAEATEAEEAAEPEAEEAEATEAEEAAEPEAEEAPARTPEEIQADIDKTNAEIEALYGELETKAQEVIDAFNNGTDFDALIAQYGEDPGMKNEPTASLGYAVSEGTSYWDSAFTEGAMSIAKVGEISGPVRGSFGVHIIYYMADITPGQVPFEDIREGVKAAALEAKKTDTYDDQVSKWVEEAHPVYHLDRFI